MASTKKSLSPQNISCSSGRKVWWKCQICEQKGLPNPNSVEIRTAEKSAIATGKETEIIFLRRTKMSICTLCGVELLGDGLYLLANDTISKVCQKCSKKHVGYIIDEVRFLPMGTSVFQSYKEVQEFILETMPARGNTYYYQKHKMNCSPNTFVLFQYGGKLVGYTVYLETINLRCPLKMDDGNLYNGYYQFVPGSIVLLKNPILAEDFAMIDSSFKRFNQSMQKKSAALLPAIFDIIHRKGGGIKVTDSNTYLPDEIEEKDLLTLTEGSKKQIIVNAYERNPYARIICINHYRKINSGRLKCEICGFHFGETYGDEFTEKIHVHHLLEISSIGEEYIVDAINDLLPVCPNCHLIAHSRKPAYTPDEIRNMLKRKR